LKTKKAKILYNGVVAPGYFRMGLAFKCPAVVPGQFVMLKVTDSFDPFLRRPFGIYRVTKDALEILYKVVGKGTGIMSELSKGDVLDVLGPLGNGFPQPEGKTVMVAGGIGIAPFYLLARRFEKKTVLLYGAKNRAEAALSADIKKLGIEVKITTEDGSVGRKGRVTDILEENLDGAAAIYSCGPAGMLEKASGIAGRRGKKAFVSLESRMACGVGVCLGCAVVCSSTHKMVCSDGPVFNGADIDWAGINPGL
jgi:dihydroorotate dehydrogenase electron transfer subunit